MRRASNVFARDRARRRLAQALDRAVEVEDVAVLQVARPADGLPGPRVGARARREDLHVARAERAADDAAAARGRVDDDVRLARLDVAVDDLEVLVVAEHGLREAAGERE